MKNSKIRHIVFLLMGYWLMIPGTLLFGQAISITASSGLQSLVPPFTVNAYQSGATDCIGTITFSTTAGTPGDWLVYDDLGGVFPPAGTIKDAGTDISDGYLRLGVSTFTITLKSTSPISVTYHFGISFNNNGNDEDVTLKFNGSCVATPMPVLSAFLTKTSGNECLGVGNTYPGYSITVSDGLPASTAVRQYNLALNGVPAGAGFTINGAATIDIPAGTAMVTTPADKIGGPGQIAAGAGFTFTLTVSDAITTDGTAAPVTTTPAQQISVNTACQDNTLYVMVNPSGTTTAATPQPNIKMGQAKDWVQRVSFGRAVFNPFRKSGALDDAPVILDNPFLFYNTIPKLVIKDLVQEVISKLTPAVLNNVKHLVLFLNTTNDADIGPAGYWSVKQMTYNKPGGGTIQLGISVFKNSAATNEIAHGIGHQFGMKDLNVFDEVTNQFVPISNTPTDWDIMAIPAAGISNLKTIHPMAEHKFFGTGGDWVGGSGAPIVDYVTKSAGAITKTIIAAKDWTSASTRPVALALQISGAASLGTANTYAWIEARPYDPGKDEVGSNTLFDGVVLYYANKLLNTDGSGRIQGYDMNGEDIGGVPIFYRVDNPFPAGIGTTGWKITSCTKNTATNEYNIGLSFTVPAAPSFDAYVKKGSPHSYLSPDIKTVIPNYESNPTDVNAAGLIAGDIDTKVIAIIHNTGPGEADVIVKFGIGRSSVTSGTTTINALGETTFATVFGHLPAGVGGSQIEVFGILNLAVIEGSTWGTDLINALKSDPSGTHYCLYVHVEPITIGDADGTNNTAQKNSGFIENASNSPYPAVNYQFYASNPSSQPRLVLFQADNAPGSWQFKLTPDQVLLAPNEERKIDMQIQAPQDFPHCTDVPIQISSYTPVDHTLIPLGGIMTYVETRKKQAITIGDQVNVCNKDTLERKYSAGMSNATRPQTANYDKSNYAGLIAYYLDNIMYTNGKQKRGCATIYTSGCTNPKQPNTMITVIYQDPSGNPIYKQVQTDANGCYTDEHVVVEGGDWTTTAIFPGDNCIESVKAVSVVNVPIAITGDQDGDGLKDPDEIQWDEDVDGIPGPLDNDSDNDGITDGNEPAGNYDCDSYPNVIDSDSDNDGIPDGKDPTPYGSIPKYRIFFSGIYHRFDFDKKLPISDGNGFNIRLGVNLHPYWGIEGEMGITPSHDAAQKSGTVYNLNLNGLYYLSTKTVMPYFTAGVGALFFNGFTKSDNTVALNGGIGILGSIPNMLPGLAYRAEVKAHYGFGGYSSNGNLNIQYSLGITYQIRTKATPCNIQRVIKQSKK